MNKGISAIIAGLIIITLSACSNVSNQVNNQTEASLPESDAVVTVSDTVITESDAAGTGTVIPTSEPDDVSDDSELSPLVSGKVVVEFDYKAQSGHASNQFAVWIEDAAGSLVKTLYATRYTAAGGYKNRPDSISLWVEKAELASLEKTQIDAITGATPKSGALSYTWDLTDSNNNAIQSGEYTVFVEGSLRWKNKVLHCGNIVVGSSPATVQADAEYIYEAAAGQPALTSNSPENAMIGTVTVQFIPDEN